MSFISLTYFVFLSFVTMIYWANERKIQNVILLLASYTFYAVWDWRFLFLLVLSNVTAYGFALIMGMQKQRKVKQVCLMAGIVLNLTVLFWFKYFNFFMDSINEFTRYSGNGTIFNYSLRVILPVGISFYTFQAVSYLFDVYRGKLEARKNFIDVALYISFFPQLVAGPIERATHLLPQLDTPRSFSVRKCGEGILLIAWGLFKKMVIADQLTLYSDWVFGTKDMAMLHSGDVLIGILAFTIQIYADFSAYSDIARGSSKVLGIELMVNFNAPYLSRSFGEFWRRWHISLSTWMRDYIYIPLGGSRVSPLRSKINTVLTFAISGLWHGANWTFVLWGLLHGTFILVERSFTKIHNKQATFYKSLAFMGPFFQWSIVFAGVMLGWSLFRAESVFSWVELMVVLVRFDGWGDALPYGQLCVISLGILLMSYKLKHLESVLKRPYAKACFFGFAPVVLIFMILFFAPNTTPPFIYFQF